MNQESDSPAAQTLTTIRRLLGDAGLSPRKRHGQHFLIDGNLMQKLLDAAEIGEADCILEVGVGTGSLTRLLAGCGRQVIGVEIDAEIIKVAETMLADAPNVTLIRADALQTKSTLNPDVVNVLQQELARSRGMLKLVANLPYDIATSLVINLLISDLPFSRLCFTVQKEVGDRFMAAPGTSDYGAVGIITQSLARASRVARVPPEAFWPRPKVESVMIRLDPHGPQGQPVSDPRRFSEFVRGFFLHRRKTMAHLIKGRERESQLSKCLDQLGIDPRARPEQIAVAQWQELYNSGQ